MDTPASQYYARSENEDGERQLLKDHLRNVAATCGQFAADAGLPRELGEWAGWLHDLGKYSGEFQRHLARRDRDLVEHAAHGAAIAALAGAGECAFAVAAHHSGLGAKGDVGSLLKREENTAGLAVPRPRVVDRARRFHAAAAVDGAFSGSPPASQPKKGDDLAFELRTRMLLSCLADADRLDAEAWKSQFKPYLRTTVAPLEATTRLASVLAYIRALSAGREATDVNRARAAVLEAALAHANDDPGFFAMTVPTGGGKTLASLAFALAHAARYGRRRVIFVVPFLTVIEQNAGVIRRAVGEPAAKGHWGSVVLEHHSNVTTVRDDDGSGQSDHDVRQRLLAENWDAPIVITTAVQFFHSLFSNHPTDLRKVHNIANSVVVFDEAQTFPPEMMRPLVGMLRQLVEEYRVTAVFCTATQPALGVPIRRTDGRLEPLLPPEMIREIAEDVAGTLSPATLFQSLKRVEVAWPGPEPTPLAEVAAAMATRRQSLAVVNTKKQARELFQHLRALDATVLHLSTRMCAAHRAGVVTEIKRRLVAGEPCLVASTQLVEAGVDIDFPAVWRAFGPLEGIAQAAGRCNREGRLARGQITVFRTEDGAMPMGVYAIATGATELVLKTGEANLDDPATYRRYFTRLYNTVDLDPKKIVELRKELDFPGVKANFKVIDQDTTPVLVPFGEGERWVERLAAGEPLGRGQLRRLQPYLVSLYPNDRECGLRGGVIRADDPTGLHVFSGSYDGALGLVLPGEDPLQD